MKNIKKYGAALAIALMTGLGVFTVITAINAQTDGSQKNENVQKEQRESKDELNESEENDAAENESDDIEDGDENDENENEEAEKNGAEEQAQQAKLAQQASITREQAELIALGRISGKIIEGDLEKENGRLIYSFDIRNSDNQMFEVEIDANTGEILKAQPDGNEDGEDDGSKTTGK